MESEEIVTEFTAEAERQTVCFTGIPINGNVTQREMRLAPGDCQCVDAETVRQVEEINKTALRLVCGLIDLKKRVLSRVMRCRMFTVNYPLLLEHIIREAELYKRYIENIEKGGDCESMKEQELFWNRIMMEHALFIRGLLDPSENDLVNTADSFAKDYVTLLARTREVNDRVMIHNEAFQKTKEFKKFKTAGVQGIENCKIKSLVLPLLADHVLREANHYLRILAG